MSIDETNDTLPDALMVAKERRRFRREPLDCTAELIQGDDVREGRLVDLGEGGARVACAQPPPARSWIRIRVAIPTGETPPVMCEVAGQVAWRADNAMGICFSELSDRARTAVRSFVGDDRPDWLVGL